MFNPHKLILPRGKKKKKERLERLFVQTQNYRLNGLRFDDKPSGLKAYVIKYGGGKNIFSMVLKR